MKTATPTAYAEPLPLVRSRWLDFLELTKPRISVMVLFTVAIGAILASPQQLDLAQLLHTLVGVALVASGASALNQWLERHTDALMQRTENRPLPSGRLSVAEVVAFGTALSISGMLYLAIMLAHPLAALIAGATHLSYVFIYTPLKRKTTLNTLIGAVPGALPPVIGWTAMTGALYGAAMVLFLIVFFWQIPHFLAIAWIYRDDYARAGLQMLPAVDADGTVTARQMLVYCAGLIPISLLPVLFEDQAAMYGFGALGLGVFFLRSVWGFGLERTQAQARRVLYASLVYLPCVLGIMILERWVRYWMA